MCYKSNLVKMINIFPISKSINKGEFKLLKYCCFRQQTKLLFYILFDLQKKKLSWTELILTIFSSLEFKFRPIFILSFDVLKFQFLPMFY